MVLTKEQIRKMNELTEIQLKSSISPNNIQLQERLEFRLNQLGLKAGDIFEIIINKNNKKNNFYCEVIQEKDVVETWCSRRWKDVKVIERGTIFSKQTNINDDALKSLIDSYARSIIVYLQPTISIRKLSKSEATCLNL